MPASPPLLRWSFHAPVVSSALNSCAQPTHVRARTPLQSCNRIMSGKSGVRLDSIVCQQVPRGDERSEANPESNEPDSCDHVNSGNQLHGRDHKRTFCMVRCAVPSIMLTFTFCPIFSDQPEPRHSISSLKSPSITLLGFVPLLAPLERFGSI